MGRRPKNFSGPLGAGLKKSMRQPARQRILELSSRPSALHTTDDGGGGRLKSVLELSDLSEFVEAAIAEERDFTAVRPVYLVQAAAASGDAVRSAVLGPGDVVEDDGGAAKRRQAEDDARGLLRIPRRPAWTREQSVVELERNERESFLNWRRSIVKLEENEHLVLTPFEKNLEVWRQLWRVMERSDIVVQIVDGRNPLLFYCEDLCTYTRELGAHKTCVLLVNKADFLPERFRQAWHEYFARLGVTVAFFSAFDEVERQSEQSAALKEAAADGADAPAPPPAPPRVLEHAYDVHDRGSLLELFRSLRSSAAAAGGAPRAHRRTARSSAEAGRDSESDSESESDEDESEDEGEGEGASVAGAAAAAAPVVVGMIGYPNVGKSTTINALAGEKRVASSATPGKTKHFQTIQLAPDVVVCDCPGLVLPSFAATKADMVCNGILPIDQLRESRGPVQLVCNRIPRRIIERVYGISIPSPQPHEDPHRPPYALEVLTELAISRGYMAGNHSGPDVSRAARILLKDYVNGRLLWCSTPPSIPAEEGLVPQPAHTRWLKPKAPPRAHSAADSAVRTRLDRADVEAFAEEFSSRVHVAGLPAAPSSRLAGVPTKAARSRRHGK